MEAKYRIHMNEQNVAMNYEKHGECDLLEQE